MMKAIKQKVLTILSLTLLTTIAYGQTIDNEREKFITDFYLHKSSSTHAFHFTKGVYAYEVKRMIEVIEKNNTLYNSKRINKNWVVTDSLTLTKNEKQYIIAELSKQTDTTLWRNIAIPKALALPLDTVKAIFNDGKRGWIYFYKTYGDSLESFTLPIFLRNNELSIFYHSKYCGGRCGSGEFAIYKRENGIWVRWFSFYNWIS